MIIVITKWRTKDENIEITSFCVMEKCAHIGHVCYCAHNIYFFMWPLFLCGTFRINKLLSVHALNAKETLCQYWFQTKMRISSFSKPKKSKKQKILKSLNAFIERNEFTEVDELALSPSSLDGYISFLFQPHRLLYTMAYTLLMRCGRENFKIASLPLMIKPFENNSVKTLCATFDCTEQKPYSVHLI